MSTIFTLYDSGGNEIAFTEQQALEDDTLLWRYLIEQSQEKTAGGQMKQQIRPGVRGAKSYICKLDESDYISFIRFITNNADDYFIEYTTAPTLLSTDSEADSTNNFKVIIVIDDVEATYGNNKIYSFRMNLFTAELI